MPRGPREPDGGGPADQHVARGPPPRRGPHHRPAGLLEPPPSYVSTTITMKSPPSPLLELRHLGILHFPQFLFRIQQPKEFGPPPPSLPSYPRAWRALRSRVHVHSTPNLLGPPTYLHSCGPLTTTTRTKEELLPAFCIDASKCSTPSSPSIRSSRGYYYHQR